MWVGVPYTDCPHKSEVPCTREDEAIAFAVGVQLGGGECSVFMSSPGFGNCINIIATLLKPYNIRIPMEVKIRHQPEHHAYMGSYMPKLMEMFGYATSNKKDNG